MCSVYFAAFLALIRLMKLAVYYRSLDFVKMHRIPQRNRRMLMKFIAKIAFPGIAFFSLCFVASCRHFYYFFSPLTLITFSLRRAAAAA